MSGNTLRVGEHDEPCPLGLGRQKCVKPQGHDTHWNGSGTVWRIDDETYEADMAERDALAARLERAEKVVEAAVAASAAILRMTGGKRGNFWLQDYTHDLVAAVDSYQKGPADGLRATESHERGVVVVADDEDALNASYAKLRAHDACQHCGGKLPQWECELLQAQAEATDG